MTFAKKQYELPKIDSENVIGSLSGILGPSPEERAAEEQRLQDHRRKMRGWTALFNGMRHLANLYYATKGAPGQKYNDPHQQIEQQYQEERKRLADIHAADRNYYANLWGLYRQVNDEQRRNMLAEAQRDYYGTREDVAREKQDLERLKAVRVIKQTDGSLVKFDPVTGETEQLSEADPLYIEYKRSQISKNNRTGTGGGRGGGRNYDGVTTTENTYNEDGKVVKKVVTKGNGVVPRAARRQIKGYTKSGSQGGSQPSVKKGNLY